ncbi:hypothetical protein CDD81_3574 [Ophiocordyceps australis]|uniref:Uncharacterized protein n=1 Tax=Ophiocordyceps australis TaxID=1399860 RepID=A0A2C5XE16_9HYPO|nr:hypothetical protein CDD81_3574 [Ophiocordyceps australis]
MRGNGLDVGMSNGFAGCFGIADACWPARPARCSSFLAGALPLSMTLSQSQLRLISSIGVGVLVGTSLIVIIPEGVEAATVAASPSHAHGPARLMARTAWPIPDTHFALGPRRYPTSLDSILPRAVALRSAVAGQEQHGDGPAAAKAPEAAAAQQDKHEHEKEAENQEEHVEIPTFEIGLSLVFGFVVMFLIDRLPRHATESLHSRPQTTHMSLDSLGTNSASTDGEADGFLSSLAPTPRRARSFATTVGLVIHAAADGIAMGASSSTSDTTLGLIVFVAIMIHKAPAAFGLTSVLLKQGLSKRAARGHLVVFSLAAPVGALSTWLLVNVLGGGHIQDQRGQWWTGMLLLFSGGTFLYVAMHAMQDEGASHNHHDGPGTNGFADGSTSGQRKATGPQMRDTLATVAGMFLPLLTQFGHHHH